MQPGQLVVCQGNDTLYLKLLLFARQYAPRIGLVYTVENVITNCKDCGEDHVTLDEIQTPFETGFPARWFRPCARPGDFDKFMEQVLPPPAEARFEG